MTFPRTPVALALARIAAVLPLLLAPALFTAAGPAHASPPASGAFGVGPCDGVETPPGHVCVPAPKQCFAAPCPQYAVVQATEGGEGLVG
ncbi:hypothetical protein OG897_28095 [Streptomyces sp. NBC_00237]|uniref:hypothetical protein n=1 Tax=Streptomyces sp. NBC_00237 TaxID=2975687 RepID=UPI00225A7ED3|nr:hypothetical protein [Streptomyces sp. NBC_00237]MCX5205306.1 hypothetical protein [Streptomyces sp. NBC_00237]